VHLPGGGWTTATPAAGRSASSAGTPATGRGTTASPRTPASLGATSTQGLLLLLLHTHHLQGAALHHMAALEVVTLRLVSLQDDGLALGAVGVDQLAVDGSHIGGSTTAEATAAKGVLLQHQLEDLRQNGVELLGIEGCGSPVAMSRGIRLAIGVSMAVGVATGAARGMIGSGSRSRSRNRNGNGNESRSWCRGLFDDLEDLGLLTAMRAMLVAIRVTTGIAMTMTMPMIRGHNASG